MRPDPENTHRNPNVKTAIPDPESLPSHIPPRTDPEIRGEAIVVSPPH
jgi:hypothetical protein